MKYHALAVDYDGTLASDGQVDDQTIAALRRLRESGRQLILVTGRIVDQLVRVFPQLGLCNLVVADNGALLYDPHTKERLPLDERPPPEFIAELQRRGVPDLEMGDVIVATWEPHETTVLQTIRDLGLELQIIFNKGAVMILPTGVNKATGLHSALRKLRLSRHNTVGIGDAENDEAFLKYCDAAAAVENALDVVKERVDLVMTSPRGAGVCELIEQLLKDDLRKLHRRPGRGPLLGHALDGGEFRTPVYPTRALVTGGPASGKSSFALAVLEQLVACGYQACVVDPRGDYQSLSPAVVLGTPQKPPLVEDVIEVLNDPEKSCVVSLVGANQRQRPDLFAQLLRGVMDYRGRFGRPHWYLIDDAHELVSAGGQPIDELLTDLRSVMYLSQFLDQLPETILRTTDLLIAMGDEPQACVDRFCKLLGEPTPAIPPSDNPSQHALAWWRGVSEPAWFKRLPRKNDPRPNRDGRPADHSPPT